MIATLDGDAECAGIDLTTSVSSWLAAEPPRLRCASKFSVTTRIENCTREPWWIREAQLVTPGHLD
jgi:hypothetical protein